MKKNILVTGGAGFIGSHLVRLLVNKYPAYQITNLDALTYAGNLANLADVSDRPNYRFVKGNICEKKLLTQLFANEKFDTVIHLAAESHVDRSITEPDAFILTNIIGTSNLLSVALDSWKDQMEGKLFYQISTDEVFGSLAREGKFSESTAYDPRSPYSASKAASDHLARAYYHTFMLPVIVSNCSNNFGSHQFPEKLIPLMIHNIRNSKPLPVYGRGENVRDWLWVEDHVRAIELILHQGNVGETYCIGGNNEWRNIDLVKLLCEIADEKLNRPSGESAKLITFVTDRKGHDMRYAIDSSKLQNELGWKPTVDFRKALSHTVQWYLDNEQWLNSVTSGDYMNYYQQHYSNR